MKISHELVKANVKIYRFSFLCNNLAECGYNLL